MNESRYTEATPKPMAVNPLEGESSKAIVQPGLTTMLPHDREFFRPELQVQSTSAERTIGGVALGARKKLPLSRNLQP